MNELQFQVEISIFDEDVNKEIFVGALDEFLVNFTNWYEFLVSKDDESFKDED